MSPQLISHLSRAALAALILSSTAAALGATAAVDPSCCSRPAWIATWATSPHATDPDPDEPLLQIENQTVRQRVRVSIGGEQVRVRLSNEHGSTPLAIGSATVALAIDPERVKPRSRRQLTFGGRSSITIPSGAPILSDPVELSLMAGAELSISLYLPHRVSTPTMHSLALKRAIVSARGDLTHADRVETQAVSEASILLSAVLVPARPKQRLLVAFGDSLTDGDASTVEADRSWPSALARRLNARAEGPQIAVINAGIGGNRLLADGFGIKSLGISALARFDRDVLSVPGVTHVVIFEGTNDLGFSGATLAGQPLAAPNETRTAEDLIGAYRQLIARAQLRGVKVIGATLTPFSGVDLPGYYTDAKEAARQTVNAWIRTSGDFDGVIDFDAVLRDPRQPKRMQARYASPDHLHPTDVGYQAMADAIDLSLLSGRETNATAAETDSARLFELNIYHALPGKVAALESRFRDAARLQAKHGLEVLGYWLPQDDSPWKNTFVYLVAHANRQQADGRWHAFHADPKFQKFVESEQEEPLIENVDTVYMRPTEYSRMQ